MNKIAKVIETKENESFRFRPTNEFYYKIKIGRKRFGQLLRNEKPADLSELERIADYFNVSVEDLILFR